MAPVLGISFVLVCIVGGSVTMRRWPARFPAFTLAVWCVTPELRRVIDFVFERHAMSPIMLAPLVVSALTLPRLAQRVGAGTPVQRRVVLALTATVAYAYAIGVVRNGWQAASFDLANWTAPMLFAAHLFFESQRDRGVAGRWIDAIVWMVLVVGGYGVVQWAILPRWDGEWISASNMLGYAGYAQPFRVRVFSTLNAPSPFAAVMLGGLLLLPVSRLRMRWPAAAVGYAALFGSLVRAAWGALPVAVAIAVLCAPRGRRLHVAATYVVMCASAAPLLLAVTLAFGERAPKGETLSPPVGALVDIGARMSTVTALGTDQSFRDRRAFLRATSLAIVRTPAGHGFGSSGVARKLTSQPEATSFDNGLLNLLYVFGVTGGLFIGFMLLLAAWRLVPSMRSDPVTATVAAAWVAVASQSIFFVVFSNVSGLMLWTTLSAALMRRAAPTRARSQQQVVNWRGRDRRVSGSVRRTSRS